MENARIKLKRVLCTFMAAVTALCAVAFQGESTEAVADTALTFRFDSADSARSLSAAHNLAFSYSKFENALMTAVTGDDPYVLFDVGTLADISADDYKYAVITYLSPASNSAKATRTELFMSAGNVTGPTAGCSVIFNTERGYKYRSQIIDMSGSLYWNGPVHSIRFDTYVTGDVWDILYIASVSFCQSAESASNTASAEAERANGVLSDIDESLLSSVSWRADTSLQNYWEGNVVYNESVYPLLNADGTMPPISLMYDASKIVSVRNAELTREYRYGVDYTVTDDGKLQILTTGSIPMAAYSSYYKSTAENGQLCKNGGYIYFSEGSVFHKTQLAITYVHDGIWTGDIPEGQLSSLPVTKSKLENKERLCVIFNGDSITYGCNASGLAEVSASPYMPIWSDLTVSALKNRYGYERIDYANTAVGGMTSEWGAENVYENIAKYIPDLVFLGFGMNDGPLCIPAETLKANYIKIIDTVRQYNPKAEFILIQCMYANPESYFEAYQGQYTAVFEELCSMYEGVVHADLRSPTGYLLFERGKRYADITGNNVNHPNDFIIRLYAQVMLETLSEEKEGHLDALKKSATASLKKYVDLDKYLDAEKLTVCEIAERGKSEIDSASDAEGVKIALATAKADIDKVKTASEYEVENLDMTNLVFSGNAPYKTLNSFSSVTATLDTAAKGVLITSTGGDPHFKVDYSKAGISADTYKYVTVVYFVPITVTNTTPTQIFLTTSKNSAESEDKSVTLVLEKGVYAYYTLDLSDKVFWNGDVAGIRIDPFQSYIAGDSLYLCALYLSESADGAKALGTELVSRLDGSTVGVNKIIKFDAAENVTAIRTDVETVYRGDVNLDGVITSGDVALLKKHLAGKGEIALASADVDGDGIMSLKDTLLIKKILSGSVEPENFILERNADFDRTLGCASVTSDNGKVSFTADIPKNGVKSDEFSILSFIYRVPKGANITVSARNGEKSDFTFDSFVSECDETFTVKTLSVSDKDGIESVRFEAYECDYFALFAIVLSDSADGASRVNSALCCAAERISGNAFQATGQETVPLNGSTVLASYNSYNEVSNGLYSYTGNLRIDFENQPSGGFNRIIFKYTSSTAARGVVEYVVDGKTVKDEFFLEASSTEAEFRTLIMPYFDGKIASELLRVTLTPVSAASSAFSLKSVEAQTVKVETDTYYLENESILFGVYLAMGGGISHYEIKDDGIDKYGNLLNSYDVGRLVQQSYYGISGAPYETAYYNGNAWRYNPVQGGDLYNNPSRIVDFEATENSLYVKTRPMDWAKVASATPSYMENTYTLCDTFVKVDNRFTDFSGYKHTTASQELPAFYTIAVLDNFSMYSGASPWSNGAYTTYSSLGPWYDTAYHSKQDFAVNSGNENWFAWHDSTGFGIALYVPGATNVLAGRHNYSATNPSCDPKSDPTSYFAPIKNITLVSGKPLEYSYLIAAGNIFDVRETFKSNRSLINNSALAGY